MSIDALIIVKYYVHFKGNYKGKIDCNHLFVDSVDYIVLN